MNTVTFPIQREDIQYLRDELADFSASRTDDALVHLMVILCGWLRVNK